MKAPILPLSRDVLKELGRNFGLDTSAKRAKFNEMWKIVHHARKLHDDQHDTLAAEVSNAFKRLGRLVNPNHEVPMPRIPGLPVMPPLRMGSVRLADGHKQVRRVNLSNGPFVVFSDHHMAQTGHPNDFFRKNVGLYRAVLSKYAQQNYSLIENGDLEELVILNLTQAEAEEMWQTFRQANQLSVAELRRVGYLALRKQHRLRALNQIFNTYRGLYTQIQNEFNSRGKLYRTAGNHDQDLQDPDFLNLLQQKYPGIQVDDYVFLTETQTQARPGGGVSRDELVRYAIGHGHQFDAATTPKNAPVQGEIFAEGTAWAFEGPDREWSWVDDCHKWMDDGTPFANRLVEAQAGQGENENAFRALSAILTGGAAGNLSQSALRGAVEGLTKYNIAWDYFENTDVKKILLQEVKPGREFFKFRHMDERTLEQLYPRYVKETDGTTPTLVLGHTHEVRKNALGAAGRFTSYLNSGAAGRFENLIWAVEITETGNRIVGWTLDSTGQPFYREFSPVQGQLRPGPEQRTVAAASSASAPALKRATGPITLTKRATRPPQAVKKSTTKLVKRTAAPVKAVKKATGPTKLIKKVAAKIKRIRLKRR